MIRYVVALCLILLGSMAQAVLPDEVLDDPALEARAREISKELRCVVCQNESIDESSAPVARDLRLLVRERVVQGDSNEEVLTYVAERYGEFALFTPTTTGANMLLWAGGPLMALIALMVVVLFFREHRRRAATPTPDLSADEEAQLQDILSETLGERREP